MMASANTVAISSDETMTGTIAAYNRVIGGAGLGNVTGNSVKVN